MIQQNRVIYSQITIVLGSLLLFLTLNGNLHLFDWDEINFAESARVVFHFVCLAAAVSHFSFAIPKYFTFSVS